MSDLPKRLVIYEDEELTKTIDVLRLGKIDAGETVVTEFFLRNESPGAIEDVKIEIVAEDRDGLMISLLTPDTIEVLAIDEVYKGQIEWALEKNVKAGPYKGEIVTRGMLTRE